MQTTNEYNPLLKVDSDRNEIHEIYKNLKQGEQNGKSIRRRINCRSKK